MTNHFMLAVNFFLVKAVALAPPNVHHLYWLSCWHALAGILYFKRLHTVGLGF